MDGTGQERPADRRLHGAVGARPQRSPRRPVRRL